MMDPILAAVVASVVTAAAGLAAHRRVLRRFEARLQEEKLAAARDLAERHAEFDERLRVERARAAAEAREQARAEYEAGRNALAVRITPLVEITTRKGLFANSYERRIGFKYQLMVGGLFPAFPPHVEYSEIVVLEEVTEEARQAARLAAESLAPGVAALVFLGDVQLLETAKGAKRKWEASALRDRLAGRRKAPLGGKAGT